MEVTGGEIGCRFEAFEPSSHYVRSECECNHADDRCHHPITSCLVILQRSGPLCAPQKQTLLPPAALSDEHPDEGERCDWVQQQHCRVEVVHESCCGCDALSSLYERLA